MTSLTPSASVAMHAYRGLWEPVQRWLRDAFQRPEPVPGATATEPACIRVRGQAVFAGRTPASVRPASLTPFLSGGRGAAAPRRRAFLHCDPNDHRRAVIGGSFAEVCAALERLEAQSH